MEYYFDNGKDDVGKELRLLIFEASDVLNDPKVSINQITKYTQKLNQY